MAHKEYDWGTARASIQEALLMEVKADQWGWYYISVANDTFQGGYVIKARGHTEAWRLLHGLGWWTEGCSTETTGPIPEETLKKIPEEQRWRRLSKEEALHLGK